MLHSDEAFICDYYRYLSLFSQIGKYGVKEDGDAFFREFAGIIGRGGFLASFNHDNFDAYKNRVEEQILSYLLAKTENLYQQGKYDDVLLLMPAFSFVDTLNEFALWHEVKVLMKLNRVEDAKKRFYQFKISYEKQMGEEYTYSFDNFINIHPNNLLTFS